MSAGTPKMPHVRRILIVRLSSIGDVVHALPAFHHLRETLPDAFIGWAVEQAAAPLLRSVEGIDRVHEIPVQTWRKRPLAPRTWRAIWAARRDLREGAYDVAADLQGLWKSALVARASGGRTIGLATSDLREPGARWFYDTQAGAGESDEHVTRRALRLATAICGSDAGGPTWPAIRSPEATDAIEQLTATALPPILLHTAANWDSKRYPDERWVEAGRALHARTGRPVFWVWGPGERERVAALAQQAGPGNEPTAPTDLAALAELCRRSALLVGGDSAPLHIAVACGTPVVGLFGPTDPGRLGPVSASDRVVMRRLECSHCHRRHCPLGTRECLESIGSDEIVAAAIERLAAEPGA
jgi:lipopolysaccharide heptosyltransferase I